MTLADLPFTVGALRTAYAGGLDPQAVIAEFFRRLEAAADPGIFITLAARSDLEAAATALGAFDATRSLWGIPIAVKDNIDVAGLPTTAACPDFAYDPGSDAECVRRLRAAGALIVGKTNLDQFATGLVGTRTPYPVPRNPIDPALVPGGSSSGSATVIARGIVPLALGTDTAGSGRVPAAFNNIVGLKPSVGAISTRGTLPACRTLDCISVFAHTVEDAWACYEAMAGFDAADPFSRPLPAPALSPAPPVVRIGVPREADLVFADGASAASFDAALAMARSLGAEIIPVDFDAFYEAGTLLYGGPWIAERHAAIRAFFDRRADSILPVTRDIIGRALRHSATDAFDGLYRLRTLARATEAAWQSLDMLCVPSVPGPCRLADVAADPFGANIRLGTYTNFVNLLDLCALAIPAGTGAGPVGVTLIGRSGDDGRLAAFGRKLHAASRATLGATAWPMPAETWPPRAAAADGIPILVLGAHLSGLPLNPELVRNGGRFVTTTTAAPDYRLFLLPGTIPRPGMLRVAAGTGASIAGEIWRLPPDGYGRFVNGIPSPLGIGTIRVSDGSAVQGFLVEAEATRGARDITAFGGWRAFLSAAPVSGTRP